MNKFTKQCVAAFASLAMAGTLCVAGAVVANNVAFATGTERAAAQPAPWSTDGQKLKGTITIHKKDDTTKAGISGATFTIQKVTAIKTSAQDTSPLNVDLKSVDGWTDLAKKVKQLNASPLDESLLTATAVGDPKTTDGNGEAKFENLDLGLYLVKETTPPTGYTSDVVPFFMTVPEITREKSATNNTYTYNVEVTPKNHNVKDAISKTADTKDMVGVGDVLPYTIDATPNKTKATNLKNNVATNLTADDLKQYAIFDDALKEAYSNATKDVDVEVKVDGVTDALKKGTGADDANNDYYVTTADTPNDNTRTRISVVFLQKGLEKIVGQLNAENAATVKPKVHVTFKFKIAETVPTGNDHKLLNKYGFVPGGAPSENHTPIVPESHTETEFRKFHIFKHDGTDSSVKLKDAKFKVFAGANGTAADSAALAVAQKCADDPTETNCSAALKGFGEKSTDGNGVTADYVAKVGQKFYIVETVAPDKYARSTKVYEVTLTTATAATDAQVVDIPNVPTKDGDFWFHLPKTGAAGVTIFAIAGMGLVGIGIFVFMRNRKKDEDQQAA